MKSYDSAEFWTFIKEHINDNPESLRLKYYNHKADDDIDYPLAITQIECRKKFGKKLETTLRLCPHFLFANVLAGEQSTGDAAAAFHASLVPEWASVYDFTAGLGIDAIHLAVKGCAVTAIDRQEGLADALRFNAAQIKGAQIDALCADSMELVREGQFTGDVAFVDPARRASDGSRVFALKDCEPDVTALVPLIKDRFSRLIVKMSPMLDVCHAIRELGPGMKALYVIGTRTECKELLADIDLKVENNVPTDPDEVSISAITLGTGNDSPLTFTRKEEQHCEAAKTGRPKTGDYIYEPWPAVMKAAPLKLLCKKCGVKKIAANTHVYFSEAMAKDFPGAVYKVVEIIPWQSKNLKRLHSKYPVINVSARNFGMTSDNLEVKLSVKPGGHLRLLAVTDEAETRSLLILEPANA